MGVKTGITTSERNRPAELGGPARREDVPALLGEYLTPERVSALVLAAIEANALYVFTHPEGLEFVERRFARIREAYAAIG
jgi:hypothetical protein